MQDRDVAPDILRAARTILNWNVVTAGGHAGLSVATVLAAEGRGAASRSPEALVALRRTYEDAGSRFTDGTGPGRGIVVTDR